MTNLGSSSFPLVTQPDVVSAFIVAPRGHDQHVVFVGPEIVTGDHMAFKEALYRDALALRLRQVDASIFLFRGRLGVAVIVPTTLDSSTFSAGANIAIGVLGSASVTYQKLEDVVINLRMAARLIRDFGPPRENVITRLAGWLSRRHPHTVAVIVDGGTGYQQMMRILLSECGSEMRKWKGKSVDDEFVKTGDPIRFIRLGEVDVARATGVQLREIGGTRYICVHS